MTSGTSGRQLKLDRLRLEVFAKTDEMRHRLMQDATETSVSPACSKDITSVEL
jgi:hypothetical protein